MTILPAKPRVCRRSAHASVWKVFEKCNQIGALKPKSWPILLLNRFHRRLAPIINCPTLQILLVHRFGDHWTIRIALYTCTCIIFQSVKSDKSVINNRMYLVNSTYIIIINAFWLYLSPLSLVHMNSLNCTFLKRELSRDSKFIPFVQYMKYACIEDVLDTMQCSG